MSLATCSEPNARSNSASNSHYEIQKSDSGRLSQRMAAESGHRLSTVSVTSQLLGGDQREVKINDVVGDGVSGVLYKWVNYGTGWRLRWFVLLDGVLSYYKIHGPDKIVVSQETEKGLRVIGENSFRRVSRHKNGSSLQRRALGEIHLQVSSIRESRSDDRRFSIYSGTKRLHLRAATREDRVAWIDVLKAVKEMFPRVSNSELMAPVDFAISTEKLRQRLQEEGVNEAVIQDCEQIMKNEFTTLQNQLIQLKQKHCHLLDTVRQLEVHEMISRKKHANQIRNSSNSSAQNPVQSTASDNPPN